MRIKSPVTYLLLLVFVCFAAGVLSVVLQPGQRANEIGLQGMPVQTSIPEASIEAPPEPDSGELTIIILGVDHIADPEGKLLAVWFLTFEPRAKGFTLVGLPLDFELNPEGLTIEQAFDLWAPPDYGAGFINLLSTISPAPVRGFVALDEHAFAVLLDYFGGITLDDQILDGSTVIGSLRLTYDNPQASLQFQVRILEGLRSKVGRIGSTPELTELTSLAPIHTYASPSPPELATLAIPLLPLEPEQIMINTYVPDR